MGIFNSFFRSKDVLPRSAPVPGSIPARSKTRAPQLAQLPSVNDSADEGVSWTVQPSGIAALYTVASSSVFALRHADATNQIIITATPLGDTDPAVLFYQRQDRFHTPFMTCNAAANATALHFRDFIVSNDLTVIPGAFKLLQIEEAYSCPWEIIYRNFRRKLLRSQLRVHGVSWDYYVRHQERLDLQVEIEDAQQ